MMSVMPRPRIIKVATDNMKVSLVEETRRFGYIWGGKKVETFYALNTFISTSDKNKGVNRPSDDLKKSFLDPYENQWIQYIYVKYATEETTKGRWLYGEKIFEHEWNLNFLKNLDEMIATQQGISADSFNEVVSPETAVVRLGGTFEFALKELDTEELFEITPIYTIDGIEYSEVDLLNKYRNEWELKKVDLENKVEKTVVTNNEESVKMESLQRQVEAQSKELDELKSLLERAIGAFQNGNSNSPRPSDIHGEPDVGDDR